jgi:hypothetical protein
MLLVTCWDYISLVPFAIYYVKTTGYCYHLDNVIRHGLAQSDPIKRCLLYFAFHSIILQDLKCSQF